jgi:hypothetical protein
MWLAIWAATADNGGTSDLRVFLYFLGGLGTVITAVVGAVVAIRKLGPETTKVQIDSADRLVVMAETSARMSREEAEGLREEMRGLRVEVAQLRQEITVERRAREEGQRREERLMEERELWLREREELKGDIRLLRETIDALVLELHPEG